MSIVREFYEKKRGADEAVTVCVLRFDDNRFLKFSTITELFNAAAKDFPGLTRNDIGIYNDHISVEAVPPAGYQRKVPSEPRPSVRRVSRK
jgi:hypothetical protein